ncbi:MAG: MFS transporter [Ginsengibacter sp.]
MYIDKKKGSMWRVVAASASGTLIEWYDFFIFGSMASILSAKFFPHTNPSAAFLSILATFGAGFVVRPFGGIIFGRLGDMIGRKYTFMVTLLLMGVSTCLIGLVPEYETIGYLAPVLVLVLRLLQGLALGGEYGGAATYVAEHSKKGTRGFWTSWIQTSASIGMLISLAVIFITRHSMSSESFDAWGWRLPFWASIFMIYISYVIRRKMSESPAFTKAKSEGTTSKNPLKESFGNRYNLKFVLLALFGPVIAQGVVWYTGHFYAMNFMENTMIMDSGQVITIMVVALLLGAPFYTLFGWLSDKIGRKLVLMAGMLLAILFFRPIYRSMYQTVDLTKKTELTSKTISTSELYQAESVLDSIYTTQKFYDDGTILKEVTTVHLGQPGTSSMGRDKKDISTTKAITVPSSAKWKLIFLVFIQIVFGTLTYSPLAAFLVELFPVRIRYTSFSVPYNVGIGIMGGLLPAVSVFLVTNAKKMGDTTFYLQGLWYPIVLAAVSLVITMLYITKKMTALHTD